MTQIDYKKVFSKLSHIKALSHDQKFDQIVQSIITYSLIHKPNTGIKKEEDVLRTIFDVYGITIRQSVIQSNLDKLLNSCDISKDPLSKEYVVNAAVLARIKKRIEESNSLELKVKSEWFVELKQFLPEYDTPKFETLWTCLKMYLCNVFEQHGIQTLHLLNPSFKIDEEDQKSLMIIVEQIVKENNSPFSKEILSSAINQFIINANEIRADYISQLADATFTSYALTSDAETVNFLNNRYNHLCLFLDTNFIFGILDLHKNSEDAAAREILEEVKKNRMPFKLSYHPETLAEFRRAFDVRALLVRATKWTRETSRVALKVDGLSPLEELFHRQNVENEIDPSVFLDKYNHVDLILKDLGLSEYAPSYNISDLEHGEIEFDIQEYQKFYEATPNRKLKSYSGFKHDIVVLREARALNPKKTKFLDSKAFFISSDFILSKFEKAYYKKNWEISYVVSPSVFLQLVRPFIQSDYSANKRFIDTFSIPELRTFEIDYTTTRSKTLQIINDNYHDTSFETKVKILRDQVLLEKLDKLNEDHERQVELIENQIAIENQILTQKNKEAADSILQHQKENEILNQEKTEAQKGILTKEAEIANLKQTHLDNSRQEQIKHKEEKLNLVNKTIEKLEQVQWPLLKIIETKYKWHKIFLAIIPVIFYAIIIFFIVKLGWNTMEPLTYILSSVALLGGYIYFAITGESIDPRKYFVHKKEQIITEVYKKFAFDKSELVNYQGEKETIEEELRSLRK